jgi:hypothetical protein
VVRRKITAKRAAPLLKSASLYSEVSEQGPGSPTTAQGEQTRSKLVFGMPAPRRISSVRGHDLEGEQWVRIYPFAEPSGNARSLRIAVVERTVFAGPQNRESVVDPMVGAFFGRSDALRFHRLRVGLALSCNEC